MTRVQMLFFFFEFEFEFQGIYMCYIFLTSLSFFSSSFPKVLLNI